MTIEDIPYGTRIHQLALEAPPGQIAVILAGADGTDSGITLAELDDRSTQVGRALARGGLGHGDFLSIRLRNSLEFLYAIFGAWKVGAVPIPMRWDSPSWEAERLNDVIQAKVALTEDAMEIFEASLSESTEPLPDIVSPHSSGICSSGSSGMAKVILRSAPAVWTALSRSSLVVVETWQDMPRPQLVLTPGPLYHSNGFFITNDLLSNIQVVLMERFDAERFVEVIEKHYVTGLTGATPMFQRVAQIPGVQERDFSSLQWVMQGASLIPPWVAQFWFDLIGPEKFYMAYGSSEGVGTVACRGDEWLERPGTLGRGWRGTEVKILGPSREVFGPGQIGEIYLRSPNGVTYQYLGRVPPADYTEEGFSTIGDLGWIDDEGYLFLADRRVDMIVTGGANVFPAEIEVSLSEHPGIADVVVIGLKDDEWGQRVHAVIQPSDPDHPITAKEVIRFAKARLSAYKVPKSVEFVAAIPRSESTKVSRSALIQERQE